MNKKSILLCAVMGISLVVSGCSDEQNDADAAVNDAKAEKTETLETPALSAEPAAPSAEIERSTTTDMAEPRQTPQQMSEDNAQGNIYDQYDTYQSLKSRRCMARVRPAPDWASFGYDRVGTASFYASRLNGRPTSSEELYNESALTAASRHLPFGSLVRVTNVKNKHSVVVRVNDCGPFTPDKPYRILDLSKAAFESLGDTADGHITVRATLLKFGDSPEVVLNAQLLESATGHADLPSQLQAQFEQLR